MHPRNVYNVQPDFEKLAKEFPDFSELVTTEGSDRVYVDFKNPLVVKALCQCLMKHDFNIDIDFPMDSLCPAVPNRLNYILWLEDIIKETVPDYQSSTKIKGIDIGVGASCIYPLLGCASNSNWSFLGTDINERSIEYATNNIERNKLGDRIKLKLNKDPASIFILDKKEDYTFSMCNPPFYESKEELENGAQNKELEPSAICTGSEQEMITEGGEYAFIETMIKESIKLKTRVRWYTSMMGLKRTIRPIIRLLKQAEISNFVVTEFTQGKTVRWAIAWSFFPERVIKAYSLDFYRPRCQFDTILSKPISFVAKETLLILNDLEIQFEQEKESSIIITGTVLQNTWSRAARRQKKRQKLAHNEPKQQEQEEKREELFTFEFEIADITERSRCMTAIQGSWLKGKSRDIFEGFWSHFKKRIEQNCGLERGSTFHS
ncbi:S-adenosyl-L-methionine dependent methyltransferase [Backusella circina FSU 941]|nr:S-adenosyl-L-methionine dependent methyltransferase [Backusella circina FSU 941]